MPQQKWDKAKAGLLWISDHLTRGVPMDRTTFKSNAGFYVLL
jgi:hypothetical protein